jgi:hypothetical protein
MCPVCVQSVAAALIGLTSSTGLVALAMSSREPLNEDVAIEATSNETPREGESHA